jgi:hypothetical protein
MGGAIPQLPQYASIVWCSVKAQGQLYLYLYLHEISYCKMELFCVYEDWLTSLYLRKTVKNRNYVFDDIKRSLNSGCA